jgi:tripartite-type tricarboxylate transporter receptor subunit TctC
MSLRSLGASAALLLTCLTWAVPAPAQTFPAKPIRIVVPFAPGGGNDVFARQLATRLGETLGQQVVIDNRPGAGGTVGTDAVAKAAPDGYTLLLGHTGTLAINPALYPRLPYDARADFVAVGPLAQAPLVLVVPAGSPAQTLADLIARARAAPGKVSFASSGNGTGGHLAGELLEEMTGVKLLHVPYKGTAPALTDVLGGQVDAMFSVIPPALPHVESGKLRALAVTGARRSARLPQTPTVAEAGVKGYESTLAYGLMAPKGTPEPVLRTLATALARAVESPQLRDALRAEGAEPLAGSAADFAALMRAENEKWGRVIRAAGIKPE